MMFEEYKFLFAGFDTVDKALDYFKDHSNDFSIIMTRDNPFGKNGITFSSQVRKLNKEIPIIILTSRGKHYVTHDPKYISANVSTVIELPVDIDTMIKTIEQHIK